MKEEARLKTEVPYEPTFFKRKTQYNNHNQISIVGNGTTTGFPPTSLGEGPPPLSPSAGLNKNVTRDFQRTEEQEENIMFMANNHYGGIPSGPTVNNRRAEGMSSGALAPGVPQPREDEDTEVKNKQINELTDMVKILLEEQRALKDKLDMQEKKMLDINSRGGGPSSGINKNSAVNDSLEVNMLMRK